MKCLEIEMIDCQYLTPNRTIETLRVSNGGKQIEIFVYNYKGQSFRAFSSKKKLDDFWQGKADEDHHFQSEQELDDWLNGVFVG